MPTPSAILAGTGSHLPERVLTNAELSKSVDTDDEWIVQRTGISARRIAAADETTASLASHAATKALRAAKLEAKDVDLILVATITPEMTTPATACFVAHSLGLHDTPAMDLNAACSGFVYGLETAGAMIATGRYKNVLVIGSETLSRITDWTDRSSCILFGDGAGAALLQASDDPERGIVHSALHADGGGWEALNCPVGSRHPISEKLVAGGNQYLKMRGREVFKFAVSSLDKLIDKTLKDTGYSADDLKLIIPHQSNRRIIESAMQRLGLPPEKAAINIDRYGNTSAASIPIALDEAVRGGKVTQGDLVLFLAVGAGLTWASALMRM